MSKRHPQYIGTANLARTKLARVMPVFRQSQHSDSLRHGWLFSLLLLPQIAFAHGAESLSGLFIGAGIAAIVASVIVLAFVKAPMFARVLLFFPLSFAFGFGFFFATVFFLAYLARH